MFDEIIQDKRTKEPSAVGAALSSFFGRFDWLQILPAAVLFCTGVLFVYGTGQQQGGIAAALFWKRQLMWGGLGFGAWILLSFADYRKLGVLSAVLYPFCLAVLAYLLFAGINRFGAKRWLEVFNISVQPSEIAKGVTIVLTAWLLSRRELNVNRIHWLLLILLVAALPAALIARQPNVSTALIVGLCVLAMVFASGIRWRLLLVMAVVAGLAMPTAYYSLKDYHKKRIMVFLHPERDPLTTGWSQRQAELAVGSGGFSGKGFMQGTQHALGYLPQTVSNSDFIFSVIAEETGFAGSLALLAMYALLLISIFRCALVAPDVFGRLICVGTGTMIALHSVVNIGMCVRLMPVAGLPLPLVSYGGTFMFMTLSLLGLVQSVYARRLRITVSEEGDPNNV